MQAPSILFVAFASFVLVLCVASTARADRWHDDKVADQLADGDIDAEDLIARNGSSTTRVGAGDSRGRTWISVVGFAGSYPSGERAYGGMIVVGLALDRVAAGPMHRARDWTLPLADGPPRSPSPSPPSPIPSDPNPTKPPPAAQAPSPPAPSRSMASLSLTSRLARDVVAAAWRAAGLGVNDARIDQMIARAHLSAALPETRLRAMRLVDDRAPTTTVITDNPDNAYTGANLWLEARLTWHFDRLLYADDEPTLERVRIERQDARARIAAHVMEALILWQRARLDVQSLPVLSRQEAEASLREVEAAATLDVLTGGWFTILLGEEASAAH